jgi:hypothetical protein
MISKKAIVSLSLFCLLFVLSCNKSGGAASHTPVTLPAGWTKVISKTGGLTMGAAPGWSQASGISPFQKLYVAHQPGGIDGPSVGVTIVPGTGGMDHKELIDTYIHSLRNAAYLNISAPKTEQLPLGDATVVTYVNQASEPSGLINLNGTKYYVFDGGTLYIVETIIPQGSGLDSDAAAMVKTLTAQ